VRYRQQLVEQRRNVKLRIRGLLRDNRLRAPGGLSAWTRTWLAWLEKAELGSESRWIMQRHLARLEHLGEELREVEARLVQVGGDDVVVLKLMSLRGIGFITAVTLRAEIGRFDRFSTGKQLSRFIGLSPRNASSGNRMADAGLVKAGNPKLRAVVIESAHRLIQFDPRWTRLAIQLDQRGKPRSVTVAAVANRWIRWLYHQMKPEQVAA
jgi:transposase